MMVAVHGRPRTLHPALAWGFLALGALLIGACGGKLASDGSPAAEGDTPSSGTSAPPPAATEPATCEAICAHVIGSCAAGASTAPCVQDCQKTRALATCTRERDAFLACLLTTPVECRGSSVIIEGCSDERRTLEHCTP
jgi:hypothetical protein